MIGLRSSRAGSSRNGTAWGSTSQLCPSRTPWSLTFSMANSSSALTWISRAFSRASCEMNATWRVSYELDRRTAVTTYHLVHLGLDLRVIEGAGS